VDNARRIYLIEGSVGDGWVPLALELNEKLNELYPDYQLEQIKEKFGGLRYYTNIPYRENDELTEGTKLIDEAEGKSYKICEECGEPGEPRYGGWVKTLCDKHHAERVAKRNP
jgi:hypothetical protein